jgi:hypothetical protein
MKTSVVRVLIAPAEDERLAQCPAWLTDGATVPAGPVRRPCFTLIAPCGHASGEPASCPARVTAVIAIVLRALGEHGP